ncbi:conserved hypothetical protein [Xenorhabdus bovienii SS-2004]|uniref:Uncharacterized protein n=1 Tax=Xenorhabdus bovienii (strain SS-2004) TaxID=406818 RepID=D3UYJ2_XENBS|nr:conserved hypothetical protein [Xenorhabdus bovienii SS-2004]
MSRARVQSFFWRSLDTLYGLEGLKPLSSGRPRRWPFELICSLLRHLISDSPDVLGYQRSRGVIDIINYKSMR